MEYRLELSQRSFAGIAGIADYIRNDSPDNAVRWKDRVFAKIATLGNLPRACSLAPEDERCSFEVRQTIFGSYRILFTVHDDQSLVHILTVRHGARLPLTGDEISSIESRPVSDFTFVTDDMAHRLSCLTGSHPAGCLSLSGTRIPAALPVAAGPKTAFHGMLSRIRPVPR